MARRLSAIRGRARDGVDEIPLVEARLQRELQDAETGERDFRVRSPRRRAVEHSAAGSDDELAQAVVDIEPVVAIERRETLVEMIVTVDDNIGVEVGEQLPHV